MEQFFYTPLTRRAYFPSADNHVVMTDETVPNTVRPENFRYAIGDKPFGAFLKGAAAYASDTMGNKGNTSNKPVAPEEDTELQPTFMQKYGLYLIGGSVLIVIVAAGITTYKALKS